MRCVSVWSSCIAVLSFTACAPEGSSAYVSYNLSVDSNCDVSPGDDEFIAVGLFDVSGGGDGGTGCRRSYFMHLLVNSSLKSNANPATGRAEPNVLQLSEAEVRLIDLQQQVTIPFGDSLPNPFRVKTNNTLQPTTGSDPSTGIAVVEAIPQMYAPELRSKYAGVQVLAEVQIFGTTTGNVDIEFKPFSFAVSICRGCLVICEGDLGPDQSPDDLYGDECADDAAADGRVCIDPTC